MLGFPPTVKAYTRRVREGGCARLDETLTQDGPVPLSKPASSEPSGEVGGRPACSQVKEEVPDVRGPGRFIWWLIARQWKIVLLTGLVSLIWLLPGALAPYLLGRAIDDGITSHDMGATLLWSGLLLLTIVLSVSADSVQIVAQTASWIIALYRVQKLVVRKVAQLGHVITRRVPAGEMLSIASSDSDSLGAVTEAAGRLIGAFVSFLLVAGMVLATSVKLGLALLIITPLIVLGVAPVLKPIQKAQLVERERSSRLTGQAVDIVAGLRILRGIGGEKTFGDNYARQSQRVREAGVKVGTWWASIDALSTLMSGILLVVLTWMGAGELLGGRLTTGELVSFFGYAVFLVFPFQTFFEAAQKWTSGVVSAAKTIGVLGQDPPWSAPEPSSVILREAAGSTSVAAPCSLQDLASGFVAEAGQLTIIVSAEPDDSAALADRLGRYLSATNISPDEDEDGDSKARRAEKAAVRAKIAAADAAAASGDWGVCLGGVDLGQLPLDEVRRRIVLSDASPVVFAGTLQRLLDPTANHTREQCERVLCITSADDVWESLPGGWQGHIDERGRGLSGGQRQRLVLARALLTEPEVLVLVEPTSAVDAHTEARIAERLPEYRMGRTTVLTTVSPLWLRHADRVALLVDGRIVAQGKHEQLLADNAEYRAVVIRGEGLAPAGGEDHE
ncbi:MAG: ABC transporter ATP-binding protein/permease [Propionibacteriaceae bacterium]|jgi:ABC-type multidrug transport system fused ATPase/permease subunit|nr:ABC transporter ATP-binding protein/permease [Propionibacteriaceae bacterium]